MSSINATEKYFLIIISIVLITLFGVFYFTSEFSERKNEGDILQPEESNNTPPSTELMGPEPEEASPLEATSYEEYLQQGIQYESTGELDKAISAYHKAAEAKPEAYVPYSNLGSIYRQNKEFAKAEEAFERALSIYPQSTSVYRKLYELYRYDLKQHAGQIVTFFNNAFEKTNNDVGLMKLYALYLEDVNDLESALAIWEAFLEAEPGNELYIQKINSLGKKIAN